MNSEKEKIKKEVICCKDCDFEKSLGFNYCDYHLNVIKYMKTWTILIS